MLSVIVPVYNVENYVKPLINSLNKQTLDFNQFEVLFIDDGSTDQSINIINENCSKDINYRILTKENGGISDARNFGIKHSKGDYISFIDSDDYVNSYFLEKMYNKIKATNSTICMCNTIWKYENEEKFMPGIHSRDNLEENVDELFNSSIACWNKIFSKKVFENSSFVKSLLFEDLEFSLQVIPSIESVCFVEEHLYYYVQNRKNSIINTISIKDFSSYEYIFDKYIPKYTNTKYFKYLEQYFLRRIILSLGKKYINTKYETEVYRLVNKYKKHFFDYRNSNEYQNAGIFVKIYISLLLKNKKLMLKLITKIININS